MKKDVVIIGAGASGLICAIGAGRRGRSVLVVDHAQRIGSKIRVSGGGRCNFTNLHVSEGHYFSENPHFCKSALSRFAPEDFISLLDSHGISFREKESGQLFCDASSSGIIRMLREECAQAGTEFLLGCSIREISRSSPFTIVTNKGTFQTGSLVIATGGLSYPKLGATDFGIRIAERFGIKVIPPKPGLVPFTLSKRDREMFRDLSGVSFIAEVTCKRKSFRGSVLITHRGLSGPAILQISSYWNRGDVLSVDLLPGIDPLEILLSNRRSRKELHTLLSGFLPSRFCQAWCRNFSLPGPICRFTEKELKELAEKLRAWQIEPAGTEGFGSAEVTVGGIDTNEVSSKTMEAKHVQGLYFIGEVLDVTGQLGGYNLHWAWASGHAAGQYV
jgi:predicted Rossmann fold flavoprotein